MVVPERLLIEVAEQMERFDAHIGSADASLQQAPEVLKAIGMDATINILDSMIYNLMGILLASPL